ncbi:MAG: GAF domain-containing protein [Chloroflexi bacterium]|nr:GAF domain-containing protein [Chloroflexota bacterium]
MNTTLRVLIVEDSENDTGLIVHHLERGGYSPIHERVETAMEMRVALERERWDIILSDHTMTRFDAPSALKLLQESGRDIPFIVVSGSIREDSLVALLKAGANDYVIKDDLPRLAAVVWREMDDARMRREHKQVERDAQRRATQAMLIYEVGRRVSSKLELDELLSTVVTSIHEAFDYYGVMLLLLDESAEHLTLQSIAGGYRDIFPRDLQIALGEGMIGVAAARGEVQISGDVSQNPHYVRKANEITNSELAIPIKIKEGVIGVLDLQSTEYDAFDEADVIVMETLADQIAVAIENAQLYKETHRLAAFNRDIIENMAEGIVVEDAEGIFTFVNPAGASLLGYAPEELLGQHWTAIIPPDQHSIVWAADERRMRGETDRYELQFICKDGTRRTALVSSSPHIVEGRIAGTLAVFADITERAQSEEETRQRLNELGLLYESGLFLSQLLPPKEIGQNIIELMSRVLGWHHLTIRQYHPEDETLELLAFSQPGLKDEEEHLAIEKRFKTMIARSGDGLSGWVVKHGQTARCGDVTADPRYMETVAGIRSGMYVPMKISQRVIGVISVESEQADAFKEADEQLIATVAAQAAIALENARLYLDARRRLQQVQALHEIDRAIAGSVSLPITLDVLLGHATTQLGVDAACVLLSNPHTYSLEYSSGRGFHTSALQHTHLRVGEGHAGRVALEQRIIHVPNLSKIETGFLRSPLLKSEGFVTYVGIPLIAKGKIKGVLEIFHRQSFEPDREWWDLLETLAGQAAVAIDNATLFSDLQQSNVELVLAYDNTLEGWAKALELRDRETEGHTRRVVERTLRLSRALGIGREEIVHIRRGALLHDIGKMGVPDSILLKPGPLNDEEWEIMRQHPVYAYEMLSAISFLRPALDIPYCHHERWDGTGYPRGLKGEHIPLSARIFAVVDVCDALMSDRPYRKAWSKVDTAKYIREQSGSYFDPRVVHEFLKLEE